MKKYNKKQKEMWNYMKHTCTFRNILKGCKRIDGNMKICYVKCNMENCMNLEKDKLYGYRG